MLDQPSLDAAAEGSNQLGQLSARSSEVDEDLSMNLLAAGIPLTLLLDLAENFGPPSAQILATEHDAKYQEHGEHAQDWLGEQTGPPLACP